MSTIDCTYKEFCVIAKEFFVKLPSVKSLDSLENMLKCLCLAYVGIKYDDSYIGKIQRASMAPALLRLAVKRACLRETYLIERNENGN